MRTLTALILLFISLQIQAESLAYQQARAEADKGNYAQAHTLFLDAAKQGDAWSQFGLGVLYLNGQGADADIAASTQWFQKAANQGLPYAQFNLGNAYLHGRGVKPNLTKAAFWWQQAAEQGNTNAQSNLGTLMYFDYATKVSKRLGLAWLTIAASQGDDAARTRLAQINDSAHENSHSIWRTEPELSEIKILTTPLSYFSINLFTARQKQSVEKFLRQHNLEGKALIYRLQRDDSFLYGILYGRYPTQKAANEIIEKMRPELRKQGPWSIALSTIQNQIRTIQTTQLEQAGAVTP